METILYGVKLNDLLEKIGQLIDTKIGQFKNTPSTKNQSNLLSRKDVSELLKISLPTLNEWTKLGWLLSYKMGNRVLYKADEVEQALCKVTAYKHKKGGRYE